MPINGSGRFIGPGQPLRDGLIGWYDSRYKEPDLSTGGDWIDISGNNKNLADSNSPGWSYGYYFDLDGTNERFRTTLLGSVGANYSLEGWFDSDVTMSSDYFFDWRNSGGSGGGGYVLGEFSGFDTNYNNVAKINWSNGYTNWHQLVATHNGTTSYLYINGELVASGTGGDDWTSGRLSIGSWTGDASSAFFNGKVGCIRLYNRLLSATEIRHNFMCDAGKFDVTIEGTS